jgi:hypothetical protein
MALSWNYYTVRPLLACRAGMIRNFYKSPILCFWRCLKLIAATSLSIDSGLVYTGRSKERQCNWLVRPLAESR